MKLNLGCGNQVIQGWINVDYSLGAKFAKIPLFRIINKKLHLFDLDWDKRIFIHNLTKKFPWKNNTIDIIYSSHTLEHFTYEEGCFFLTECHRILKHNGIIRIVVPDLQVFVKEYIDGKLCADQFIAKLGVLSGNSKNPIKNFLSHFIQFPHKCMYDTQTLLNLLNYIGFDAVSKKEFNSAIEDIKQIENKKRTEKAVIVEGRKR